MNHETKTLYPARWSSRTNKLTQDLYRKRLSNMNESQLRREADIITDRIQNWMYRRDMGSEVANDRLCINVDKYDDIRAAMIAEPSRYSDDNVWLEYCIDNDLDPRHMGWDVAC